MREKKSTNHKLVSNFKWETYIKTDGWIKKERKKKALKVTSNL